MNDEEGLDFIAGFKHTFRPFQHPTRTQARWKAERRAGLTPKQRAKLRERNKAPPKTQMNFRVAVETKAQLEALSKALGLSMSEVFTQAIAAFAKGNVPGEVASHSHSRGTSPASDAQTSGSAPRNGNARP